MVVRRGWTRGEPGKPVSGKALEVPDTGRVARCALGSQDSNDGCLVTVCIAGIKPGHHHCIHFAKLSDVIGNGQRKFY